MKGIRKKRLYFKYLKMKFFRFLGIKSLIVDMPNVRTTSQRLKIGEEYQFREGIYIARVKLEDFRFEKQFFYVHLCFLDEGNRISECCHRATEDGVFLGMWALVDKGNYDLEKYRKRREYLLSQEIPDDMERIYV